jgi:hypothetical protein
MNQLTALLKPFSGKLVHSAPSGKFGDYVSHYVVEQRLLAVVGPYTWDIAQVVTDPDGTVTGCVGRLTVEVDGRRESVSGAGDVENPKVAKTNGARLKLAESDAFKRAAMRLGVALHLWAGDEFYLYKMLEESGASNPARESTASGGEPSPGSPNREDAA